MDPVEWMKECERVKDQLKININPKNTTAFETEAEEVNARRKKMLSHIKVVKQFAESNVPLLMENLCS